MLLTFSSKLNSIRKRVVSVGRFGMARFLQIKCIAMKLLNVILLLAGSLLLSCNNRQTTPRAKHVVLLGFDAMSARGVQRAHTPNFNEMIENGAVSIQARCIRPTSSSQNWMSMVSGANIEMHGVTDNDWEPDKKTVEPALKNRKGLFPTIFEDIKTQRPDAKVYMFYEWTGQDRMYDISMVDKAVTGLDYDQTLSQAFDAFLQDRPEFLFVSINQTDHIGHETGHESREYFETITHFDAMVGDFVKRVKEAGLLDETVIIVTADHGGLGKSHGGDSEAEREIPIILYGGSVTKGKVMEHTNLICDIAATVGGLLGVELPQECVGKFISEAFEPKTDKVYVPMPFISPFEGFFKKQAQVTVTGDVEGAEIYYTLDGTTPTDKSAKYTGPFMLDKSAVVQAVVYRQGQAGKTGEAMIRVLPEGEAPKVAYKYYENMMKKSLPDFNSLGKPTREGYVYEFTLDELDVEEKDHFAVLFTTKLNLPEAGQYTFGIISDDGAKLYIDGKEVIDNDGSHSADMKYGNIELPQGIHDVKVEYFDDYMGQKLEVYYKAGEMPLQMLPFANFVK